MRVIITLKPVRLNGEIVQPGTTMRIENNQKLIKRGYARKLTPEETKEFLADYARTFEKLMEDKLREIRSCYNCGKADKWESIYGAIVCSHCHPPLKPELVKRYIVQERQEECESPEQAENPGNTGNNKIIGGSMKLPKSNMQFEKVKVGEFVPGRIAEIEYDMGHKFYFQGTEKVGPGVRFVFELEGYKYPHKSRWVKFMAFEKAPLYTMYISKLVENVKPSDTFDLDALVGMEVKTMWANDKDFQVVESIEPIDKKLTVTIEEDDDGFTPEIETVDDDDVPV
jgi:hypothetical protein